MSDRVKSSFDSFNSNVSDLVIELDVLTGNFPDPLLNAVYEFNKKNAEIAIGKDAGDDIYDVRKIRVYLIRELINNYRKNIKHITDKSKPFPEYFKNTPFVLDIQSNLNQGEKIWKELKDKKESISWDDGCSGLEQCYTYYKKANTLAQKHYGDYLLAEHASVPYSWKNVLKSTAIGLVFFVIQNIIQTGSDKILEIIKNKPNDTKNTEEIISSDYSE